MGGDSPKVTEVAAVAVAVDAGGGSVMLGILGADSRAGEACERIV